MNKFYYILTFAMSFSIMTAYSPPDSCLKIFDEPYEETFENPDSVRVDSCKWSDTYGEFYGKGIFYTKFNYNIIPRSGLFPEDTIIEYTWEDIPLKYSQDRLDFQQIENKYGQFYFREHTPHLRDTTSLRPRSFEIRFEKYVNIDSLELKLSNIGSVDIAGYVSWFRVVSSIENEFTKDKIINIYPNPATDIIKLEIDDITNLENISIYTTEGIEIKTIPFTDPNQEVNISDLTTGVYFIKLGNKLAKFVKQ